MVPLLPRIFRVALLLAGFRLWAADDLPKRVPGERQSAEPRLMLDDLPDIPLPPPVTARDGADAVAVVSVERAKAELERARGKQQRWQKLAQAGVLSQVEAESTAMQAARASAQAELLHARREQGESTAEELAAAETAQRTSAALAAEAAAQFQRLQRLAAAANLGRQRRLFALGIGSRGQLQRAQAAVEKLPANPAPK